MAASTSRLTKLGRAADNAAAATLTVALLAGCGSDSGLRSPDYKALTKLD